MGHEPQRVVDVGVAGLHRLLPHIPILQQANVIIVVAGMEGALASVVGGLVTDAPVIAVPTSIGYGASFGGLAALLAMLNSCASGVAVVNIDNGFGAGHMAALINEPHCRRDNSWNVTRTVSVAQFPFRYVLRVTHQDHAGMTELNSKLEQPAGDHARSGLGAGGLFGRRGQRAGDGCGAPGAGRAGAGLHRRVAQLPGARDASGHRAGRAGGGALSPPRHRGVPGPPLCRQPGTNRCYFCKIRTARPVAGAGAAEGWAAVADGNNASDLGDYRPGMQAARERNVRSPLLEAGITKAEVRAMAQALGLPVWDKPAMACLSSRVPHGTAITPELLRQIEAAEDTLVALGFRQFRVRHHGEIARIELPVEDFRVAMSPSSMPISSPASPRRATAS